MTVIRHPNNQGVTLSQWRKTAAGGETSVSGTDDFSAGLAYTAGAEQVFVNGVLLERGVDYTASTGTTVTGLTALVAGDIVTVSSPSAFNVANAIPKATITAKGDLLVGTGASTPTNLGVGADGTTLVANSASATGVAWTAGNPIPNPVLNSAFQIWQRGTGTTSIATSGTFFLADRWQAVRGGYAAGGSVSRQATNDTTNLPFIQYAQRVQRDSGNTSTATLISGQNFESINSIPFAGKTVTLSYYARAGANYSPTSSALSTYLYTGTGTDQNNLTSTFTGSAAPINGTAATLTTTWQRFSFTATLSSTATQISISLVSSPTGTAGANDYFEFTGVQLDIGSVALPFRTNAPTLQGELAACQRYLPKLTVTSDTFGMVTSTTQSYYSYKLPVTARVAPTSTTVSALSDFKVFNASLANGTPTAINFNAGGLDYVSVGVTTTAGSPTIVSGQCALFTLNNAGGYILFNGCEL